jgi:VIT1/CCC1 family predicted Fe2+/Mn2+ transporter
MKPLNLKKALPYVPEILLAIAAGTTFMGDLLSTSTINYFMLGCLLILLTLIIWKNKYFALILSFILGLSSFYMLLAVLSEYSEFPAGDRAGLQLLAVGMSLFTSLLVIAFFLPKKYIFNREI